MGFCGGARSERVKVWRECLEVWQRDVVVDGVDEDDCDEENGSKEEGRYLVHRLVQTLQVIQTNGSSSQDVRCVMSQTLILLQAFFFWRRNTRCHR